MDAEIRNYLVEIGRRGGRKSRRQLSRDAAQAMVRIREARRAFRRYYHRCFWSFDPNLTIGADDVSWVAGQLRRYGDRKAWEVAARLCP